MPARKLKVGRPAESRWSFLLALPLALVSFGLAADVYKYTDANGQIYFTDSPLSGRKYQLEWQREADKLITETDKRLIAIGSRRFPPPGVTTGISKKLSARRAKFSLMIDVTARRFNLKPELIHAVVRTESAYNPSAVSPAGAIGLMQLMPGTAKRYRVANIWDPAENLRGGAEYLRYLLDLFDNDLRLALAGYNAGENAVIKYGKKIPPYPETQRYVRKVMQYLWAERADAGS